MRSKYASFVGGVALVVTALWLSRLGTPADTPNGSTDEVRAPLAPKLLGPLAGIVSDLFWFAAQRSIAIGEFERAIVLAERAVEFAPRQTLGWERYGSLVGTLLASPESEPDPALRLAWVRAALDIFERGQALSDDPGRLALARAVLLLSRADVDPDLPWPRGPAEPWELAAEAFDTAADFRSHPLARELAREAKNAARELAPEDQP